MKYNKLVRDNIPEIMKKHGENPRIHIADSKEYWAKLIEKIKEESAELEADQTLEEVADILEVIDAICELKGFDMKEIKKYKKDKLKKRGGFKRRIILEES